MPPTFGGSPAPGGKPGMPAAAAAAAATAALRSPAAAAAIRVWAWRAAKSVERNRSEPAEGSQGGDYHGRTVWGV
jgi:hypothetical protein